MLYVRNSIFIFVMNENNVLTDIIVFIRVIINI